MGSLSQVTSSGVEPGGLPEILEPTGTISANQGREPLGPLSEDRRLPGEVKEHALESKKIGGRLNNVTAF
jgi:hypothetical protein